MSSGIIITSAIYILLIHTYLINLSEVTTAVIIDLLSYAVPSVTDPEICIGDRKIYFYFFKRPERYNQEVLSHTFICLPLPYVEGIV